MNKEFKGTNEIWWVDGHDTTSVITKVNEVGYKHICKCDYGHSEPDKHFDENYANAHLIAASPELLAACIEFLRVADIAQDMTFAHIYKQMEYVIGKALNIKK